MSPATRPNCDISGPRQLVADIKAGRQDSPSLVLVQDGNHIGTVIALTGDRAAQLTLIEMFSRWRHDHRRSFLTVFAPSPTKTKTYIESIYLPDPGRLLFLVEDCDGHPVGHLGFCRIESGQAELDNVIRGEWTDVSGLMRHAMKVVLSWAFETFDVSLIYLHVLSDNARALRAYLRVGFVRISDAPLFRRDTDDGYVLVSDPFEGGGRPAGVRLVRMELNRESFYLAER